MQSLKVLSQILLYSIDYMNLHSPQELAQQAYRDYPVIFQGDSGVSGVKIDLLIYCKSSDRPNTM